MVLIFILLFLDFNANYVVESKYLLISADEQIIISKQVRNTPLSRQDQVYDVGNGKYFIFQCYISIFFVCIILNTYNRRAKTRINAA